MSEILQNRAIIAIHGKDASNFLQNLITNDINIASTGMYSYMLNSQGRYIFDFFIVKHPDGYLLVDLVANNAELFIKKLSMYKLRAAIEIIDVSDLYKVIYSKEMPDFPILCSYHDPRFNKLGWRSIIESNNNPYINFTTLLYISDKYKYAIPDGEIDLVYDISMISQFGAEELNAISYNKGCYIGQEIVARTKHIGAIRKKIFKAISKDKFEPIDLEVMAGDVVLGKVCSVYNNEAIVLLNEEKLHEGSDHRFTINDHTVKIEVPEWRS